MHLRVYEIKGNTRLHLRISHHNIFTRFPLLFNYSERSCAHIRRKRTLFLLLFINVASHSRFLFLLVHRRALPRFHRFIRIVVRFVAAFDYCARAFTTTGPRANALLRLSTFVRLRGLPSDISEGNILKRLFLNRVIYSVFRISGAISSSTNRIIYVVCLYFLRVQTRGEWKFGSRMSEKCDVSKEDYYKDCSLAISRRSSATILLPILTSS